MKRLCQIVVCAYVQSENLVIEGIACGDNQNSVCLVLIFKFFQNIKTATAGKIYVQNNTGVVVHCNFFHGGIKIKSSLANELFVCQVGGNAFGSLLLIFYDQHFHKLN